MSVCVVCSRCVVLGLTMEASDAEIKKAYRKLSLKYHPGALFAQHHLLYRVSVITVRTLALTLAWLLLFGFTQTRMLAMRTPTINSTRSRVRTKCFRTRRSAKCTTWKGSKVSSVKRKAAVITRVHLTHSSAAAANQKVPMPQSICLSRSRSCTTVR